MLCFIEIKGFDINVEAEILGGHCKLAEYDCATCQTKVELEKCSLIRMTVRIQAVLDDVGEKKTMRQKVNPPSIKSAQMKDGVIRYHHLMVNISLRNCLPKGIMLDLEEGILRGLPTRVPFSHQV